MDFRWLDQAETVWHEAPGGWETSTLPVGEASGGVITADEVRVARFAQADGDGVGPMAGEPDLEWWLVLSGWVDFVDAVDSTQRLDPLDAIVLARGSGVRSAAASDDFRAFRVTTPQLPTLQSTGTAAILRESPGAWGTEGIRAEFEYRDLGLREVSGGQLRAYIKRSIDVREGRVPPHRHGMSQWFTSLVGWFDIDLPGGSYRVGTGDHMVLPVNAEHGIISQSPDNVVLVCCTAAQFDSDDVAPWGMWV